MKTWKTLPLAVSILFWCTTCCAQQFPWQEVSRPLDERVEWLVERLTLEEKLSLMVHQNPAIERLGLPAYSWWNEALHGVGRAGQATVYPMPIALAATFDPALVRDVFCNVALEARCKHREAADTGYRGDYAGLTFFTPNINLFRDPRWGRGMETYGECPYLTARMGLACVNGLQHPSQNPEFRNQNPDIEPHTGACLKHLAVHSGPEGVRHEFNSVASRRDLRTSYLPAFEYIIKNSDVAQVMCAYNRLNGVPCCTHGELFDLLRNEWHYDGIVVTDCWALNDTYEPDTVIPRHRTHATAAEAYGDAFGREVDLECGSGLPALREAVEKGYIAESKIDEHVRRLLRLRLKITPISPITQTTPITPIVQTTPITPAEAAARSLVLLKNNGILPLAVDAPLRLEGHNLWDSLMPLGNYNGTPRHTVTLGEALSSFSRATSSTRKTRNPSPPPPTSPIVIYCGGLSPLLEGEELQVEQEGFLRGDRTRIELPRNQVDDIRRLKAEGCRIVLVLCTGSALALEEVMDDVEAVLVAWYGGEAMGTAVADALRGLHDGFGHLPITFYRSTADLPPFEDYSMQQRTYRYADPSHVSFSFGFGLGYSRFALQEPTFDTATLTVSGRVSLLHTDAPQAPTHRTVVQLYMRLDDATADEPSKQLVGLCPVALSEGGGQAPFSIRIDPFWLRRYNPSTGRMEPSAGCYTLLVGFSSNDLVETFRLPQKSPDGTK